MTAPDHYDHGGPECEVPIETLCCTLFYLLSRQAQYPEQKLQDVIRDHFLRIALHQDVAYFPQLLKTCRRLATHWQQPGDNNSIFTDLSQVCH